MPIPQFLLTYKAKLSKLRRKLLYYTSKNTEGYRRLSLWIPELAMYKTDTLEFLADTAKKKGFSDLSSYADHLEDHPSDLEALRTNLTFLGTHFFRGNDWDFFDKNCLASFQNASDVRVWCAGCSSGKEVYSLIMLLHQYVPLESIHVLATDYNDKMLEDTKNGVYYNMHLAEIPEALQKRFLTIREKKFTFNDDIREIIDTKNLNLLTDSYPTGFDIILCRNVLKFFDPPVITEVHKKLVPSLNPGGYLFVSTDDGDDLETVKDPVALGLEQIGDRSIYRKF
ncbi:MAG: hypothetical protein IJ091_03605 [Oscillospiraceae bacterium]|nr:hypothetical protein [Oscillospiraceae bacterium]